jgi:ketosteroid isomerase-like protein
MSQDVEIVRRFYDFEPEVHRLLKSGGSLAGHPWLSLWHPECVLEEPSAIPDAGVYRGRDEVAAFFERAFREVWDEWRFVPTEIIQGENGVLVAVDNYGRSKTGTEARMQIFSVLRIREGMIGFSTGYLDRDKALEAVGFKQ